MSPQAYPENRGPIFRSDGSYVIYDFSASFRTSRPWTKGHRGWVAYDPAGRYLGYFPHRYRRGGLSPFRVPKKYKTAEHALDALQRQFPLDNPTKASPSKRAEKHQ